MKVGDLVRLKRQTARGSRKLFVVVKVHPEVPDCIKVDDNDRPGWQATKDFEVIQ